SGSVTAPAPSSAPSPTPSVPSARPSAGAPSVQSSPAIQSSPPAPITPSAPPPSGAPPKSTTAAPRSYTGAIVTGVLGVIAGGGGTFSAFLALNEKRNLNTAPTTEHADTAERDALLADGCFGLAIVFGVTAAVLLFTTSDSTPTETARSGS